MFKNVSQTVALDIIFKMFFGLMHNVPVMPGRSVHLTTLISWESLTKQFICYKYFVHILSLLTDNIPSWISGKVEMIS